MSEIEKMYKNAGTKKTKGDCLFCPLDVHTCERSYDECPYYYPPFTVEKQIELIKLLLFSTWWINLKRLQFAENFEQGLAELINNIWQDLTEEEKQQVKGILE